jgi:hypothetical protein
MMTEAVSPDREVMIALGPETPGVRNNMNKINAMDAMAAVGIQAFFEKNADPIVFPGLNPFLGFCG